MVKVYLDSNLINDIPDGFNELKEVIERDTTIKGYVIKYDLELTFYGDGYNYIFNKKQQSGFCNRIEIRIEFIEPVHTNIITGYFFLTDIIINHTKRSISTPIEDTTYGALINTGKKIKISPRATESKNLEAITPVNGDDISMFNVNTGVALATDARMYNYLSVFEHQILYLSDNLIAFSNESDVLTTYKYGLTSHYYIQNRGTRPDLVISFEQLMEMAYKLWGLWFKIDLSTNIPTFVLKEEEEFFEAAGTVKFNAVRDCEEKFNQDDFFTTMKVGSTKTLISRDTTYTLPKVPLIGFHEEVFNSQSDCTLDAELDLTTSFIYDQNKLEKFTLATTTEGNFEEEITIVEHNGTVATEGAYGIAGKFYYNESLLNVNVIERHPIPTDMSLNFGQNNDGFLAVYTATNNYTADANISFEPDDDTVFGNNAGANYDPSNGRYTCTTAGMYRFRVHLEVAINSLTQTLIQFGGLGANNHVTFRAVWTRYNAGGSPLQSYTSPATVTATLTQGLDYLVIDKEQAFYLEDTDYVEVNITIDVNPIVGSPATTNDIDLIGAFLDASGVLHGCWFETILIFNGGGVAIEGDYSNYFSSLLSFDYPINNKDWNALKSNPAQGVTVNTDGANDTTAWISRIERNPITGESKVELLTSINNTQL